jgi:hypothetical protein
MTQVATNQLLRYFSIVLENSANAAIFQKCSARNFPIDDGDIIVSPSNSISRPYRNGTGKSLSMTV